MSEHHGSRSVIYNTGTLTVATGSQPSDPGQTLDITGTLVNLGLIDVGTDNSYGGAALLAIEPGSLLANHGTLVVVANPGFYIPNSTPSNTLTDAGRLSNSGVLTIEGGGPSYGEPGGYLGVTSTGTLTSSGTMTIEGGAAGFYGSGSGGGGTLSNLGTFGNFGTLTVERGNGGYRVGNAGPGVLLNQGVMLNAGTTTLQSGRTDFYGNGTPASFTNSGRLANSGTFHVSGGGYIASFVYQGQTIYYPLAGRGATLNDTGVMQSSGLIDVGGGLYGSSGYQSTGGELLVTGTLGSTGVITLGSGQPGAGAASGAQLVDAGLVFNAGLITVAAAQGAGGTAATLTISGTLINHGTISGGGVVQLSGGTIEGGGVLGSVRLFNDGVVLVQAGETMRIAGAVAADGGSSGVFELASGACLTLAGSVGVGERVDFAGADALLAIGRDFAGALSGVQDETRLDLLGMDVTAARLTPGAVLATLAGGAQMAIALAEPAVAGLAIALTADGHGGTTLAFGHAGG